RVVHVVVEHVAIRTIRARHVRKRQTLPEGALAGLIRCVSNVVGAGASGPVIAPDVVQVEPVPDFMGRSPTKRGVEREGSDGAKRAEVAGYPLDSGWHAGKGSITKGAIRIVHNPDVQVLCNIPRIVSPGGG